MHVARSLGMRVLHSVESLGRRSVLPDFTPLLAGANLSLSAPESMLARELEAYDAVSDIPFLAPAVIEQASTLPRDVFLFVATNRSRDSWITSMMQSPDKGWSPFRVWYGLNVSTSGSCKAVGWATSCLTEAGAQLAEVDREEWGAAWDAHQLLLQRHQIPTINLDDPDPAKWAVLCDAIERPSSPQWRLWADACQATVQPWPRLFRSSSSADAQNE
eukprot:2243171-Prymnesium_polylepis.1